MDLKGRLLGNRYEILEKIGSGGMATVYKAKCHVLNRYVAIKILRDEFTTDEEFVKRFEVEAQSAASITHPNIVSIYDVGVDGNLHYIVMELIKGKTLKDIIVEEKGPLPWKWSVNIAIQIASALETAHRNHIIHRDIKPHNIIITEDGVAKVTDFGIAKAVSNSTITAFGTTIGSVHYFSPEHARGGYTDEKSDIYSLGVVMYEMLTGRVPFDADTPVSVALKHMQEEPTPAIAVNPSIPIAVNDIIMKALKKDTNLRYQSATAMLIDLRRALKEPNGNFVDNSEFVDFPTQRISTITDEEQKPKSTSNKKKTNKFKEFIQKHKVLSTLIGLILLFALSLGLTIGIINMTRPKEVAIPNLVGKTVEEAKQLAQDSKLIYVESSSEYNTTVEAGKIISQDPPYVENRNVKENTEIKVVVSLGTEKTTVPKFTGLTKEDAQNEAKNSKLNVEIIEETSKTVEAGIIISQETEEGTEVNAGDTIKIYVSIGTGIRQVVVTSVFNKDEATAKKTLEDAGLVVEVEYEEDTTKPNGTVLKQSIASGETVDEGTTITITVNKLAETKTGTVTINVKSLTGYKDKVTKEEDVLVSGKTEKVETVVDNKPKEVSFKVTVDDYQRTTNNEKVLENETAYKLQVSGVGTIKIIITIDGKTYGPYSMDLNTTTEMTIDANTKVG